MDKTFFTELPKPWFNDTFLQRNKPGFNISLFEFKVILKIGLTSLACCVFWQAFGCLGNQKLVEIIFLPLLHSICSFSISFEIFYKKLIKKLNWVPLSGSWPAFVSQLTLTKNTVFSQFSNMTVRKYSNQHLGVQVPGWNTQQLYILWL